MTILNLGAEPELAHIRDVPASCLCPWAWNYRRHLWRRVRLDAACPWHTKMLCQADA